MNYLSDKQSKLADLEARRAAHLLEGRACRTSDQRAAHSAEHLALLDEIREIEQEQETYLCLTCHNQFEPGGHLLIAAHSVILNKFEYVCGDEDCVTISDSPGKCPTCEQELTKRTANVALHQSDHDKQSSTACFLTICPGCLKRDRGVNLQRIRHHVDLR